MMSKIMRFLPLLSPMVVKELRQEMRMRSFGILFLVPQVIMALVILVQASSPTSTQVLGAVNGVFWPTLVIPLLILIPRRGIMSFAKEVEAEALELVLLTRMNAWCVVVGKWLALTFLSLLFLSSMFPYMVLRYFIGDKNPLYSLTMIGAIFAGSLALTALSIGFSSSTKGKRSAGVTVLISLILLYVGGSLSSPSVLRGVGFAIGWKDVVVATFLGILGIMLLLEVGVSQIAPVLEMYALRKRSLALVGLAAGFIFIASDFGNRGLVIMLLTICLVPVMMSSMYESLHPVVIRFIRSKKSPLAWLIYPGWPGGVVFSVAATFCFALLVKLAGGTGDLSSVPMFGCIMVGALLMPYALMRLLFFDRLHNMFMYLFLQCVILVSNIVHDVDILRGSAVEMLFSSLPLNALVYEVFLSHKDYSRPLTFGFTAASALIIFYQFILVVRSEEAERGDG